MTTATLRPLLLCVLPLLLACTGPGRINAPRERITADEQKSDQKHHEETTVNVHYLEIVTPEVDETCDVLEKAHGVAFGEPVAELGNARTTTLKSGGRIGVRAPMRETEEPVVRPYVLADDIDAAVEAARAAGAEIAIPPMEIPGQGKFAIYILGGIEHGLWQR